MGSSGNWYQGDYVPDNMDKLLNEAKVVTYRSLLERRFHYYCDHNPGIIGWAYENIKIPYYDLVSQKDRTYFVDYMLKARTKHGDITYLVEIKSTKHIPQVNEKGEFVRPELPKKKSKKAMASYDAYCELLLTNWCKFNAARKWCEARGMKFLLVTEKELYGTRD